MYVDDVRPARKRPFYVREETFDPCKVEFRKPGELEGSPTSPLCPEVGTPRKIKLLVDRAKSGKDAAILLKMDAVSPLTCDGSTPRIARRTEDRASGKEAQEVLSHRDTGMSHEEGLAIYEKSIDDAIKKAGKSLVNPISWVDAKTKQPVPPHDEGHAPSPRIRHIRQPTDGETVAVALGAASPPQVSLQKSRRPYASRATELHVYECFEAPKRPDAPAMKVPPTTQVGAVVTYSNEGIVREMATEKRRHYTGNMVNSSSVNFASTFQPPSSRERRALHARENSRMISQRTM